MYIQTDKVVRSEETKFDAVDKIMSERGAGKEGRFDGGCSVHGRQAGASWVWG